MESYIPGRRPRQVVPRTVRTFDDEADAVFGAGNDFHMFNYEAMGITTCSATQCNEEL